MSLTKEIEAPNSNDLIDFAITRLDDITRQHDTMISQMGRNCGYAHMLADHAYNQLIIAASDLLVRALDGFWVDSLEYKIWHEERFGMPTRIVMEEGKQ